MYKTSNESWDDKQVEGLAILARGSQITRLDRATYRVKSQSGNGSYLVIKDNGGWKCECPSYQHRKADCKHVSAVRLSLELRDRVTSDNLGFRAEERPDICPSCGSNDIVRRGVRRNKKGTIQRFMCKACGERFVTDNGFARMRNDPNAVTPAMDLYFKGISLRKITDHLKQFYGVKVHYSTVLRWIEKYIEIIKRYTDTLTPELSGVWHADEMAVKINGTGLNAGRYNYQWLWSLMDEDTRFLLATKITPKRGVDDARKLFKGAKEAAKTRPEVVITDGLHAYIRAFKKEFYTYRHITKHVQLQSLEEKPNNNILERLHGTIWGRKKVVRAMDNPASAERLMEGNRIYYKFIGPHMTRDRLTPAEMANVKLGLGGNRWLELIKKSYRNNEVTVHVK